MSKYDKYPKQFLLSLSDYAKIENWKYEEICGIKVSRSECLPLVKIIKKNEISGFLLGWFTCNGIFYYEDNQLNIESEITDEIYKNLCGRFLIIEKNVNDIRITTDPGSQLAVVYDECNKIVASSPAIISTCCKIEKNDEIVKEVTRFDNTIWYPFGLVPYEKIKRILPGRRLNLLSGEINSIQYQVDNLLNASPKTIAKNIFDRVSSNIYAISKSGPLKAHLTAGYDSRMVLSSCLLTVDNITWQTIKLDNTGAKIDCEVAKKITNLLNLKHEIIFFENAEKKDIEDWLERTSYCIKDAVSTLCTTIKVNDDKQFILTGSCGEVGRSFYWQEADINERDVTPEEIIFRLGFMKTQILVDNCNEWKKSLSESFDKTTILDIAYIDNRLGCWAGPSVYGHDIEKPTISPFNEGEIYNLMLNLPKKYRLNQQFAVDYISFSNKILLSIPFNRAIGIKKMLYLNHELRKMIPAKIKNIIKKYKFI